MPISQKSLKLLWAASGGRCAMPRCDNPLIKELDGASAILGEMAHICGERVGSARFNNEQSEGERDSHTNLILLCPTHHTEIDKPEFIDRFSVETLIQLKRDHERSIALALRELPMDKVKLIKELSMLAAKNKAAWQEYGPVSERAKSQPHNDHFYETWRYKRLTVIVPNNRKMVSLLNGNSSLIDRKWHASVSEFLEHAESYEGWVNSEDEYGAVVRFPESFESFLKDESDACKHA